MRSETAMVRLRRRVLTELAKLAREGALADKVATIMTGIATEKGPRYRCCVHKERAVLRERINIALSQPLTNDVRESAILAAKGHVASDMPIVNVLLEACDQCPLDKFLVTDACQNCIAHHCIASCPRKAISIHHNRACIDETLCIKCGMCRKSCPYGAIIENIRPCERACELGALHADSNRRAIIDYDKCVQCGACINACPFGAIGERTYIVQVIQEIRRGKEIMALIAPSIEGQFGVGVSLNQIISAIKALGFENVYETAEGAEITARNEAREFKESVIERHEKFLTTSCCPAFVSMIRTNFGDSVTHISKTVSPMATIANVVKKKHPDAILVFIGPCAAKKTEALEYTTLVDFVITYEELLAMFTGAGIETSRTGAGVSERRAPGDGNGFACSGGVLRAVGNVLNESNDAACLNGCCCEGLKGCKEVVAEAISGKRDVNFIEGMACCGGCVGGSGVLVDRRVASGIIKTHAIAKTASDTQV